MKWVATKRNYHGQEAAEMIRWVVHKEGKTRGICECWDGDQAQEIADLLNVIESEPVCCGEFSLPVPKVGTWPICKECQFHSSAGCSVDPQELSDNFTVGLDYVLDCGCFLEVPA